MSKMSDFYSAAINDEKSRKEIAEILGGKTFDKADDKQLEKIGALAKKLGFDISIDEAKGFLSGDNAELDEDDLDAVAGGKGGDTAVVEFYKGDELIQQYQFQDDKGKLTYCANNGGQK